ncbi:uncharacterized protein LOC134679197 [Cydia fagiglandana]|uniref:uncharacterized protein LOC134679197 n=1 Tax=Cydia fagiglandana TaxID=1458189 RepID=UPI002FEE498A
MECSNQKCKKMFDLKCLAIQPENFDNFTEDYKDSWVCPECACLKPKGENTQRGSSPTSRITSPMPVQNNDSELLTELRGLRNESMYLKKKISNINRLQTITQCAEQQYSEPPINIDNSDNKSAYSFAEAVSSEIKQGRRRKVSPATAKPDSGDKSVATKSAVSPLVVFNSVGTQPDRMDSESTGSKPKGGDNKSKKAVSRKNNFMTGENTSSGIRVSERKKHLHVWRLALDITSEQVETHVLNECGTEISVKVQKIKHKHERDYASFIIGVPENKFHVINQPRVWPHGAQFSEWLWFRGSKYETEGK